MIVPACLPRPRARPPEGRFEKEAGVNVAIRRLSAAEGCRQPIFPLSCQPGTGFPRFKRTRLSWRGLTVTVGAFRRRHLPVLDAVASDRAGTSGFERNSLAGLALVWNTRGSGRPGGCWPSRRKSARWVPQPCRGGQTHRRAGSVLRQSLPGLSAPVRVLGQRVRMSDAKGPWHRNFGTVGVCLMSQKTIQAM